jgi:hypothetical protein
MSTHIYIQRARCRGKVRNSQKRSLLKTASRRIRQDEVLRTISLPSVSTQVPSYPLQKYSTTALAAVHLISVIVCASAAASSCLDGCGGAGSCMSVSSSLTRLTTTTETYLQTFWLCVMWYCRVRRGLEVVVKAVCKSGSSKMTFTVHLGYAKVWSVGGWAANGADEDGHVSACGFLDCSFRCAFLCLLA